MHALAGIVDVAEGFLFQLEFDSDFGIGLLFQFTELLSRYRVHHYHEDKGIVHDYYRRRRCKRGPYVGADYSNGLVWSVRCHGR